MASDPRTAALEPIRRYSNWAVTFHWTTVILVLAQAYLGFAFNLAQKGPGRTELFTWHKTVGALILVIRSPGWPTAWSIRRRPIPAICRNGSKSSAPGAIGSSISC